MPYEKQESILMESKKVVLFLVEGISDKVALERLLQRLNASEQIFMHMINGDITSEMGSDPSHVLNKITEQVKEFISQTKVTKEDIVKIIHIVDTDGAYVDEAHIKEGNMHEFVYEESMIQADSKEQVEKRNGRKSSVMDKLSTTSHVFGVEYSLYYMSCNLDHVLHNERNLNGHREKYEKAIQFSDRFRGKEQEFISFMNQEQIAVPGKYKETWEFIRRDLNSLSRKSNFHLYVNGES